MTAFSKKFYRNLSPLIKPRGVPCPLPWDKIFGRTAPLELEIGFGNGEYLNRTSQQCPHIDYVGVEVAWASIKRALRRLATPPRPNVRVMNLGAETALAECFAPKTLGTIRALFPIPWPCERQAKKRLFNTSFLNLAANTLKDDGQFIIVTDSEPLARWTMEQGENSALKFSLSDKGAELDTKYERKWQGGGQRVFYHLLGHKTHHPDISKPSETKMQAYYMHDFNPQTYKPQDYVGEVVVRFREFIFDPNRPEGLLRVLVLEGPLSQDFYIRIKRHENRWKVSAAISAELFPTHGVAKALKLASGNT
ncbi:MAG: tRNA (guanine(46)-N(7))-methyltransferase TrmB [Candidatus Adiutrix sp.]